MSGRRDLPRRDTEKQDTGSSSIARVRFFTEPPDWIADHHVDYITTALPKDFVENADKELKLNGELVRFVKAGGSMIFPKKIPCMEDSERRAFFSRQVKPGPWCVYYGSGGSGIRYSILVEFKVREKGVQGA